MSPALETRQSLCLCSVEPMGAQAQLLCPGQAKRAAAAKDQYPGKVMAPGRLPNRAWPARVWPFDLRMRLLFS
jgi:hypothetical protein